MRRVSEILNHQFLAAIEVEESRAHAMHGEPRDIYEMLAILGEEFGELQAAVLDFDYDDAPLDNAAKECIQVGAMALKLYKVLKLQVAFHSPRGRLND